MLTKTAELTGAALDWAVAKCERVHVADNATMDAFVQLRQHGSCRYSTNWGQGGPIIEREGMSVHPAYPSGWVSLSNNAETMQLGAAPLIAAMRCYVASKLGDDVDVPSELVE